MPCAAVKQIITIFGNPLGKEHFRNDIEEPISI
jgi:hypothetical protein